MLKESFINNQGFGIVMEESTTSGQAGRILPVGTRVKVTDFYTLNDGMLGITVLGLERFCIHEMETDELGLRRAKVETLPNWPSTHSDFHDKLLVNRLREVFEQYPELDELYRKSALKMPPGSANAGSRYCRCRFMKSRC